MTINVYDINNKHYANGVTISKRENRRSISHDIIKLSIYRVTMLKFEKILMF